MIERIGGPDRDRTDDLFHAMEARSQLRHRPTYGGMQLFYCLRWGLIRQTLAVAGFEPRPGWNPAPSRPRQRSPGVPGDAATAHCNPRLGGKTYVTGNTYGVFRCLRQ